MAVNLKFNISAYLLALVMLSIPALAQDSQRLQIGFDLFPAVIAANTRLEATDVSETLPVYLVYRNNRQIAEQLVPDIESQGSIKGHPLRVHVVSARGFTHQRGFPGSVDEQPSAGTGELCQATTGIDVLPVQG